MNRRTFLASSAATVALAPYVAANAAPAAVAAPMPSWVIGTPGEYDWMHCGGLTEHQAKLDWLWAHVGEKTCEQGGEPPRDDCDCEVCASYSGLEGERVESWDTKEKITAGDWLRAGLGHLCSRCGYETDPDEGHGVGDEAVCGDCMKLEDWAVVDPARAAEMRADLAELEA